MTTYVNYAKAERRMLIKKIGIRQYKRMQRNAREEVLRDYVKFDQLHVTDFTAFPHSVGTVTVENVQIDNNPVADTTMSVMTDKQCIVWFLSECPNGSTRAHISETLREHGLNLSDTQVERRLKNLREAGSIRYDKASKGWFVVTE